MADETVRLTLHGLASENGHVRLADFLRELQLFGGALKKYDRFVSGGSLSSYYRVVDLSHSSPATVVIEGQPKRPGEMSRSEQVMRGFFSTIAHIQETGELTEPIDLSFLRSLKQMGEPVGRSIAKVEIGRNGHSVPLDLEFTKKLTHIMAPEEEFVGTVSGMLEAINLHDGANVFYLYPDVGPEKVKCHFSKDLEDRAIQGVKHFVTVYGLLRRKTNAPYAHAAYIDSIEVMPADENLPRFLDLLGVAPGLTGNLSSEDFTRELRNAQSL